MSNYNHQKIEKKWQKVWKQNKFKNWTAGNFSKKKKFYILDMFPYPSGDGLHVGHIEGYTATDIYSRYLRMNGFNVLHPMGFDAFGLPAENYAIKNKVHPTVVTQRNISHFKAQMEMMGLSYDWQRELQTCDPEYYKWTQWIVLQMFHHGLAYQSVRPINWCPSCKTGLANEDLENGRCERCGSEIERRPMRQWFLKITDYADRLLEDLEILNWPEGVKEMQKNWIGKSHGYEFEFVVQMDADDTPIKTDSNQRKSAFHQQKYASIRTFTTRLDTIFGATFLVLAPEHPLAENLATPEHKNRIFQYINQSKNKTDLVREVEKEKTGVFTGSYAINPANQKRIPVWVADYVMMGYGTGAVMGVPAHDERDFAFAKKFNLEIIEVISPDGKKHLLEEAFTDVDSGFLINSGPFDRMPPIPAQEKIANFINAQKTVHYKLEDWGFDRQRYWGEPMPLVFCNECKKRVENSKFQIPNDKQIENWKLKIGNLSFSLGEASNPGWIGLEEKDLPLKLPKVKYYEPTGTGESPLAGIESWVNVKCPNCGKPAKRETNTMPQWAGSCWYYLAFVLGDKKLKLKASRAKQFWDQKVLRYWLGGGVDFYVGGVEHATRHLIYARFWHKFLFDIGVLPDKEPFAKLVNQGMILGSDGQKMSKSLGNVVNPDEIIKKYGADCVRMYEMFMGPLEASKPWDINGIVGVYRFLNRVWQMSCEAWNVKRGAKNPKSEIRNPKSVIDKEATQNVQRLLHQTIKKVGEDILAMQFNTAVSSLMEFSNAFNEDKTKLSNKDKQKVISQLVLILLPFAPHLSSEIWSWQNKTAAELQKWPKYNPVWLKKQNYIYAVQVNGKVRDTLRVPVSLPQDEVVKKAKSSGKISKWLSGKKIKQTIFVKDRIINFVV